MEIMNAMTGIEYAAKENGYDVYGNKIRVIFDEDTYHDIEDSEAETILSGVELNSDALPMLATAVKQFCKSELYDDELRDVAFDIACDTVEWVREILNGGGVVTLGDTGLTGKPDEEIHEIVIFKIAEMLWPIFPVEHLISRNAKLTAFAAAAIIQDAKPIGFPVRWGEPIKLGDYENVHEIAFLTKEDGTPILGLFDNDGQPIVAFIIPEKDGQREIYMWLYTTMENDEHPEYYAELIQETFLKTE